MSIMSDMPVAKDAGDFIDVAPRVLMPRILLDPILPVVEKLRAEGSCSASAFRPLGVIE